MSEAPIRPVRLWQPDVKWEKRSDGSIVVWQEGELLTYPARIADRVRFWAEYDPSRLWMAERDAGGEWQGVSYGELYIHMHAIAQVLLDLKLNAERPLAILSGNSVGHGMMALAAQFVGIPTVALDPSLATGPDQDALRSVQALIGPGAIYAEDMEACAAAVDAVFADLPRLGKSGPGLHIGWDDMLATDPSARVEQARAAVGPKQVARLHCDAGPDGACRAVIQTHQMLCSNMEMVTDCFDYLRDEPPIVLDGAPWWQVTGGNLLFNAVVYNGGSYHIDSGVLTPDGIAGTARNLEDVHPNWQCLDPERLMALLAAMRDDAQMAKDFFGDLKAVCVAGGELSEQMRQELAELSLASAGQRVTVSTALVGACAAGFVLCNTDQTDNSGAIGVPAKELQLRLVPSEGAWQARVKGPSASPGFWRDKEASKSAVDKDGYVDLGVALRLVDPADPARGVALDGPTG